MTQLNNNTSTLQEILSVVNNLPESGGGSTELETCQVTVTSNGGAQITYISGLAETDKHRGERHTGEKVLTVVKNTTIFFSKGFGTFDDPWLSNLCYTNGIETLAFITQDCSTVLND